MNEKFFKNWLSNFYLGWMPIATLKNRQIFKITDLRIKCRYFFVMAYSRKDVMEWIVYFGKNLLSSTSSSKAGKLVWFSCELTNRGIIREYFEIDRILEHEIPEEPFPVYELIGNLSFKQYFKKKNHKNSKNFMIKNFVKLYNSIGLYPSIHESKKDWSWNYYEAVFQTGIFLKDFQRMYLLRCLYRREKTFNEFLGWKVQLLRDFKGLENLVNPFWNISIEEEKVLEKILQSSGFFPEKNSQNANKPEKERKRRCEFQKNCSFIF